MTYARLRPDVRPARVPLGGLFHFRLATLLAQAVIRLARRAAVKRIAAMATRSGAPWPPCASDPGPGAAPSEARRGRPPAPHDPAGSRPPASRRRPPAS